MIPETKLLLFTDLNQLEKMPSLTFKINKNRIDGFIDEKSAVIQAIDLIFRTERFEHAIYSHNYGVELRDLFSTNNELLMVRLELRIQEALLVDDRIKGISDFSATQKGSDVTVNFTVNTIYGEDTYEKVI